MTDLHTRLVAALQARLEVARAATSVDWLTFVVAVGDLPPLIADAAEFVSSNDPASTIRRIEALLRVVEHHQPTLETVEWFHDQTGKGEAECCPSCRPEDPTTDWRPRIGEAGIEPEGFVPSYVVSPCPTLRDLATGEGIEVDDDE